MKVTLELSRAAGADEDAGNTLLFQNPAQGTLGQCATFGLCLRIPCLQLLEQFGREHLMLEEVFAGHA